MSQHPIHKILFCATLLFATVSCQNKSSEICMHSSGMLTDTTWESLTIREKIGQLMIVNSTIYDQENYKGGNLDSFFIDYPVGGFFMADWYFKYQKPDVALKDQIKESIKKYRTSSKYPLIFMEDYERGVGERVEGYTQLPVLMAVGATRDSALAYNYGKSISLESRDLGINWLLHPVADLSLNPLHDLVNERAISDKPDLVISLLSKQVKGMKDQGIIATAKHFPGDGVGIRDQHLITASNNMTLDEWESTYGNIFQELIHQGIPSIMVGHIIFPAFQQKKTKGRYLPGTLSSEIIADLLKNKMQFNGVTVSDAMNMGGVAGYCENELETAIASFKAGIDMLLWPNLFFMDTLEARILRGEISENRLNDAVSRVWNLKKKYGLFDTDYTNQFELKQQDQEFIQQTATAIAEKGLTLVKKEKSILPLDTVKNKDLLLVVISESDKTGRFVYTKQLLEEKGFNVDIKHNLSFMQWNWRLDQLEKYKNIILCMDNSYLNPTGTPFFRGLEAETVWLANTLPRQKMIGVSYSSPYYNTFYFDNYNVLMNAYSSDIFMQKAVVDQLTGTLNSLGVSPVELYPGMLE